MIKETFDSITTFSFDLVSSETIFKEIVSLDTKKAAHSNDVPAKIVKANVDLNMLIRAYSFITNKITKSFNMALLGGINNSCIFAFNESVISCKFLSLLK